MCSLCQGKGSLQTFRCGQSMEEGKRWDGEKGTGEKDEATDRRRVEGTGVGEVGEGEQVDCPGLEGCRCTGEDSIVRNIL